MMKTEITKVKDPTARLFAFIRERHTIYVKRQEHMKPPWTKDPILGKYRFCNVYRNLDRVTAWIHDNWCKPNQNDPDLWFAMCVARLFNLPESLQVIGYPVPFDIVNFSRRIRDHKRSGAKCFNGAYIVSTNGIAREKVEYVTRDVLEVVWKARERLRPRKGDTVNSWHMQLMMYNGFGGTGFMAAQVAADTKQFDRVLKNAPDKDTFVASGPGSRKGLNAVLGRGEKDSWTEEEWRFKFRKLYDTILPMFEEAQMPRPDAQDFQNCLCEYFKYHRATALGQMPKQRYRPG
jgi:5-hmdU DNA kinase, helical domain